MVFLTVRFFPPPNPTSFFLRGKVCFPPPFLVPPLEQLTFACASQVPFPKFPTRRSELKMSFLLLPNFFTCMVARLPFNREIIGLASFFHPRFCPSRTGFLKPLSLSRFSQPTFSLALFNALPSPLHLHREVRSFVRNLQVRGRKEFNPPNTEFNHLFFRS